MKKIASLIIILMVLGVSTAVLINMSSDKNLSFDGKSFEDIESAVAENIPFREELTEISVSLQYLSGVRHFDNIYIGSEGSLLPDIEKPTTRTFSAAKNYILSYSEKNQIKPYFMLVPTSSVILQQEIENFAGEDFYNQRYMISHMYSQFEDKVRTTDVYQTLFDRRGEYIYYHTEDMPTALGGYFIYGELCNRLGLKKNDMDSFSSAYVAHGFYGSLATDFFRPFASPDFITLYEYIGENNEFIVEHYSASGRSKVHEGLFIQNGTFEDKTDIFFGGISPIMSIKRTGTSLSGGSLLLFGDESAKSWLPFLASNYGRIVFVELDMASPQLLSSIKTADYDQVLFAYSTAKFSSGIDFSKLEYVG